MGLWRLDTAVDHAQEYRWIAVEVNHQLLGFLHEVLEVGWANGVSVVEEDIAFTCQLYLQVCQASLRGSKSVDIL